MADARTAQVPGGTDPPAASDAAADQGISVEDLDALREQWEAVFGERMPWGFEIKEAQVPMLRRCIRLRSQEPLKRYVASLGDDDY